jgi:hypothetical protein
LRWPALDPEIRRTINIVSVALLIGIAIGGCSFPWTNRTTEDASFLTPPSDQTLAAFRFDSPIKDKMDAVIAARLLLGSTRLRPQQAAQVTSVEELPLAEAQRRIAQAGAATYEGRPANTRVWLVIFRGEWQVFPPDPSHTITPAPPAEGCVFVLMDANDSGRSQVGSTECTR